MATRSLVISDLSSAELDDTNHVTAIITHPDVSFPVQIDLSAEEAEKLQETPLRLVGGKPIDFEDAAEKKRYGIA
jgi:1-deoxy-D-xylulose 5-phosphate reductoisomerase